jgi:tetratricopeptide (TPR) repeat protein
MTMTPIATNERCERFRDDLAAVVDGDDAVLAGHLDHLAECEACRDARHEAMGLVAMVAAAGDDFVAVGDLEERVLAAAVVGDGVRVEPASVASGSEAARAPRWTAVMDRVRTRRAWVVAGGLAAAAAVLVVVASGGEGTGSGASGSGSGASGSGSDSGSGGKAWAGSIAVVDRSGADTSSGVEVRPAGARGFASARAGAAVAAGAALRTDESTRLELVLDDGSRVYLDHATEIELARGGRELTMARGNLVADVAHLDRQQAVFRTPAGQVDVVGTRFSLSATGDSTSVRVVRGAVRLASATGRVDVRAGEEGVVTRGRAPEAAAAGDVVGAVGWSELLSPDEPADELAAGIGELRAFKPGEERDRDWKLALSRHKVTVRIAGNVARTEIEETFQNDSSTALEGVYRFPLPPDARIERLALDVDGKMEEGAFVGKERAAKIWRGVIQKAAPRPIAPRDEIIWVPGPWRDPALLEWQQGGRFELRIFPIPRKGSRTIQLAYTQILEPQGGERRYVYPLPHRSGGAPAAGRFDIDVRLSGIDAAREPRVRNYAVDRRRDGDAHHLTMTATGFRPRGDFAIDFALPDSGAELRAWSFRGPAAAAPTLAASRRGGADPAVVTAQREIAGDDRATALLALRPHLPRWTESRQRDYVLVVDSSQSMVGERFARARKLVTALVGEMDRRDRFAVLACDVGCQAFADGPQPPSAAAARRLEDWLGQVRPAGASDLVGGLERAAEALGQERKREAWILHIGDGSATTGYRRMADLRAESEAIAARARVSISAVGIGGDADAGALAAIARAGGGFFTPYVPGQRAELAALSVLETTFGVVLKNPVVELPAGLADASPGELPNLRAGQELLIAARMSGPVRGDVVLRGTVGGKPYENRFPLALEPSEARGNAFVPRVWAALTIERMELEGRGEDQARIVALSQAYGVLSRHTSLLVLESPAMFRAFGIDRSRSQVAWSGEEAAEGVESGGAVDYHGDTRRSRRAGAIRLKASAAEDAGTDDADMADASPLHAGGGDANSSTLADLSSEDASADFEETDEEPADEKPAEKNKKADARGPRVSELPARRPIDGGRVWIPMRRVWFRVGSVSEFGRISPRILDAVARAEASLGQQPDSRERHRVLVQALAYAGDLDRAFQVASAWLERDRMDPEALGYLADLLGRQGRRAEAVRMLSGAVDLAPGNRALHLRLAAAYDRVGEAAQACSHRIALAAIAPADADLLSGALRCQRAVGRHDGAERLVRATRDDRLRSAVETSAAVPRAGERAKPELLLDASWAGAVDLDLSLVTPDGKRLSWLGGRTGLAAERAGDAGRERLGLRRLPAGNYLIEVARSDPGDRTPVSGTIAVSALGARRTLPFDLTESRVVVGRVAVARRSRLVPLDR